MDFGRLFEKAFYFLIALFVLTSRPGQAAVKFVKNMVKPS